MAKNLRNEYFKIVKELVSYEEKLQTFKKEFVDIESDMSNNEKITKDEAMSIMNDFEKKISDIENILSPKVRYIKKLEEQADILFENIKKCYPDMTTEEIQKELIPYLEEIKLEI